MSSDKRLNRKLPERVRREDTPGIRIDSGPFIGIIKNNVDPTRAGRLQVWIPDLGGQEDDPKSWRTVSYASPFYGVTYQPNKAKNNKFTDVQHSYGMWAVVPDIGNQVICTFIAGDANRGFWFACINPNLGHHMVPALGTANAVDNEMTEDSLKKKYDPTASKWPVAEFNENVAENISAGWTNNPKPVHEFQANVLIQQGLDRDGTRGAIGSSSQRESPSMVFGISTPGRPVNDPADNPQYAEKLRAGTLSEEDYAIRARKGGHQLVMDDGEQTGANQLFRLRSAGGHQILMNDTERVMYIANSDGSVWFEFTGGGHINVFSASGINMRTGGEFNLHADKDINIHSGGSIKLKADTSIVTQTKDHYTKAGTSFNVQAGKMGVLVDGTLSLQSSGGNWNSSGKLVLKGDKILLNTETPGAVPPVADIKTNKQTDTGWDSEKGLWINQADAYESIATTTPAHEPWPRGPGIGGSVKKTLAGQFGAAPQPAKQSSVCAPPGVAPSASVQGISPQGANNEAILESALQGYGITNVTQFAQIMAQCAHVSGNFQYLRELGNDSYFQKYEGRADLGNTQPGDGLKYKGRGFIQITGRDIYARAGLYLGLDLINQPHLAEDPVTAAKLVLFFFFEYKKSRTASVDWNDVTTVTRIVNGGTNGLTDRKAKFDSFKQKYAAGIVVSGSGQVVTSGSGAPVTFGSGQLDPGPEVAKGKPVVNPAPAETMKQQDAPNPAGIISDEPKIPGLIPTQMKALMLQIGYAESKLDYAAQDASLGRIGRYKFNGFVLRDYGYIKKDYVSKYGTGAVFTDSAYTGKDGITDTASFMAAKGVQDNLMETILNDHYKYMVKTRGIQLQDDVCTVAGMLSVAYFMRDSERGFFSGNPADQAKFWREQGNNIKNKQDQTPDTAYNQGRYAIDVLSIASTATTAVRTGVRPATVNIDPDSVFNFSSGTGSREAFDQLAGTFKDAILSAAQAYKDKTGKKLTIFSAYRGPEDQERIYDAWLAAGGGPNKPTAGGITTPALPASRGGKVNAHGAGAAVDFGQQAAEVAAQIDLASFGLRWGGTFSTPDPVHIQLASYNPGGPFPA